MTTNPQANERPILFSAPMVRAILDGRKTQTRRIVKPQPEMIQDCDPEGYSWVPQYGGRELSWTQCPYGQPGDRLGVREAHSILNTHGQHRADGLRWGPWGGLPTTVSPDGTKIAYYREGFDRADPPRWRPSIHMPRWASRLTLEVTGVKVERLQDISEADALAEGVVWSDEWSAFVVPGIEHPNEDFPVLSRPTARAMYAALWDFINGLGAWSENTWVAAVTFRPHLCNIDAFPKEKAA